jgi:hypothetical protein
MSTFLGKRQLLDLLTINPALENMRSAGVKVAGMQSRHLLRNQVRYFKCMRAHNGIDAVAVRRARFFQAPPHRIEIKTSQLFRMPQAHCRSRDKNLLYLQIQ